MVQLLDSERKPIELKNILYIYRNPWTKWSKSDQTEKSQVKYAYNISPEGELPSYALGSMEILGSEYSEILENMPRITKFEPVRETIELIIVKYKGKDENFYYVESSQFLALSDKVRGENSSTDEVELTIPFSESTFKKVKISLRNAFDGDKYNEFIDKEIEKNGELKQAESKNAYVEFPKFVLEFSDGRAYIFNSKREVEEGLKYMLRDQEFMKTNEYLKIRNKKIKNNSRSTMEHVVPKTPEEIAIEIEKEKERKKRRAKALAITFGVLALAGFTIMGIAVANKIKKGTSTPPEPTFTPTPTIGAKFTPSPTPSATPTQGKVYKTSRDFIDELKEKNYKYLINGDTIQFGEKEVENFFKLLEGKEAEVFEGLSDSEKLNAILNYYQIIMLYASGATDPYSGGPINIGDYCDVDVSLYDKISNEVRNLALLSVDQPLNGKIIDSNEKTGKFSDEYVNAAGSFVKTQTTMLKGNPTHDKLNNWYQLFLDTIVIAGDKLTPEYFYINSNGERIYIVSFIYVDENGKEILCEPIMTTDGVRYKDEKTGEYYTTEEMQSRMNPDTKEYDPSMEVTGIANKTMKDREEVFNAILKNANVTYQKDPQYKP